MKVYSFIKRGLELVCSALLLVLLSPFLFIAALLIKMDSRGPIFFRQERAGKNGRIFRIYKFRTMKSERYAPDGRELSDFERLTPLGRFIRACSIDELPQIINIILGEMSLIGPRPLLPEYLPYYSEQQMRRHDVTPGITGWAQINGRNATSWEERLERDVWYVEHFSFWLDMKIFVLTFLKVFKREGINQDSGNTMERFDLYMKKKKSKVEP